MTPTIIGLVFFFTFFLCAVLWLFRPGAKKKYKDFGEIPLKEGKDD